MLKLLKNMRFIIVYCRTASLPKGVIKPGNPYPRLLRVLLECQSGVCKEEMEANDIVKIVFVGVLESFWFHTPHLFPANAYDSISLDEKENRTEGRFPKVLLSVWETSVGGTFHLRRYHHNPLYQSYTEISKYSKSISLSVKPV